MHKKTKGFTSIEMDAMRARAKEMREEARSTKNRVAGERAVVSAIKAMKEPDRSLAKQLHSIITKAAPQLTPKTWYGMPAYARNDKVVCFFQSGKKFKMRYSTFGFQPEAKLDEGALWPTSFALKTLGSADIAKIKALVKKAIR